MGESYCNPAPGAESQKWVTAAAAHGGHAAAVALKDPSAPAISADFLLAFFSFSLLLHSSRSENLFCPTNGLERGKKERAERERRESKKEEEEEKEGRGMGNERTLSRLSSSFNSFLSLPLLLPLFLLFLPLSLLFLLLFFFRIDSRKTCLSCLTTIIAGTALMPSRVKEVGGGRRRKWKRESSSSSSLTSSWNSLWSYFTPFFLLLLHYFRQLKKLREREKKRKEKETPLKLFLAGRGRRESQWIESLLPQAIYGLLGSASSLTGSSKKYSIWSSRFPVVLFCSLSLGVF